MMISDLACQAAIELDNLILERSHTAANIHTLATWLLSEEEEEPKNSATLVLLYETLREFFPNDPLNTVSDLTQRTRTIAHQLKTLDKEELQMLRTFCLLLSKKAANESDVIGQIRN